MTAILFVCLGNICRSPLAEGVFRHLAGPLGRDVIIDSAGTGGWHVGSLPDRRSIEVARRNGIDITGQRARKVEASDFRRFSHILAMDRHNLADLRALTPAGYAGHLGLFLDHAPQLGLTDVPDPYYGGADGFDHVFRLVEVAAAGLLKSLERR